ncbi:metal ABC transporter substrate-binding protein [Actinomyces glycerinitolerans]|uniref:Zinc-uptake complex component a periplasmic n=1 Tax=Actinomyces glycerinitolerans TaxID=1892869 RepID=A0A1M4RW42_9ACTO|nr:metal ABC transporter substrate-binding protein [Actinomyces glycerinitolerans]SHE24202.1 zinc-uptake complex component a periplasmic [Actinomyces glycerinitolerans]
MRTIINTPARAAAALASLALTVPLVVACTPTDAAATGAIKVVSSTTQICDYVTQLASGADDLALTRVGADGATAEVGADPAKASVHVSLTCLLAPNASAHEHEMTAAQSRALSEADLLLVNGVDLERFLNDAVDATGFKGTMVVTSGVLSADEADAGSGRPASRQKRDDERAYTIDRGAEAVDVAPWPFAPEGGEEAEFRYDPHVWTSPRNAVVQVSNIGRALAAAAPDSKEVINKRVRAYVARLDALDRWAAASLESVPENRRVLFTSHDAFGYLAAAYSIRFEGAALSDFNAQQDATAQKIQETADAVKSTGAVAIFAENSNNPKSVEKVAQLAGVTAVIGDEALYGDSLGGPGTDGETYVGSLLHNVTNMTNAWGGTVAPIPDELAKWAPKQTVRQ